MNTLFKYLVPLIKVVLFGFLVWFFSRHLHWQNFIAAVKKFGIISISGVLTCHVMKQLILAKRMQYSAKTAQLPLSLRQVFRWELEILFLEYIIPLPDAEDFFRVFFWRKNKSQNVEIFSALIFSRICGFLVLSMLLPFAVEVVGQSLWKQNCFYLQILWTIPFAVIIFALQHKTVLKILADAIVKVKFVPRAIPTIIGNTANLNISILSYLTGCVLAIAQLCVISAAFYILVYHAKVNISFLQILALSPLVVLSIIIPFSIQGLGIPEAAMVWILIHLNVNAEIAIAIGLVHFFCGFLMILSGGVLLVLDNKLLGIVEIFHRFLRSKNFSLRKARATRKKLL